MSQKKLVHLLFGSALLLGLGATGAARAADGSSLENEVRSRAAAVEPQLIAWRRDIHQHPELGDQ